MFIETKRLVIRDWTLHDVFDMYEYAKDPRVGPMAGWPIHKNRMSSKKVIEQMIIEKESFALVLKENNKVIGGVGIHYRPLDIDEAKEKQRELGYVLNPKYWGNGYVPEAVEGLKKYCFEELKVDQLWITCYNNNHNSIRVIEKCGLTYEGVFHDFFWRKDHFEGRRVFSILKHEYETKL